MRDVIRSTLGSKSALRLELDDVDDRVLIDRGEFELGLLNLTLNARDAMRDLEGGGILTIKLSATELTVPRHASAESMAAAIFELL